MIKNQFMKLTREKRNEVDHGGTNVSYFLKNPTNLHYFIVYIVFSLCGSSLASMS